MAVIEQSGWQTFDAAKLLFQLVRGNCQGIVNADLLGELDRIFGIRHGIEFESDDGKSARGVEVEEFLVAGHFFFARLTPGGPKIDEYHLTAKIYRGDFPALKILYGEAGQAPLDILLEGVYAHLVCLPKNNENASSYCRGLWTC